MFRLFRFAFKAWFVMQLMALAFSAGMGAAYLMQLRAQYRTWGLVPGGNERGVRKKGNERWTQAVSGIRGDAETNDELGAALAGSN